MALRGNLKDFSLPDVFQLVTFSKKTGVLRIERTDDSKGSVWFRDGEVFFAQSNWHGEPLGERLVHGNRITPSALARALEVRKVEGTDGRRLGQILVDEGYITDQVLEAFVQEQIQDTIFDLMRWDEGDFDFELLPDVVDEDIGLTISIENVIMEGSRRLEEWARIKKKIPSMEIVFKMATAPGEGTFEISLKPVEWNLLLLVDGTRSVAELARQTSRTDFEVARIMYGLFSAGLLEVAGDDEVERLRGERIIRERELSAIKVQQAEEEARVATETVRHEAELEARAQARRVAEEPVTAEEPEPTPAPPVAERHEPEIPEFLSGGGAAPTAEDMSVFEQMMGAVLEAPAAPPVKEPEAEVEPVVEPTPELELELLAEPEVGVIEEEEYTPVVPIPEPPSAESYIVEAPEAESVAEPEIALTGDLETDLMALGLGELPGEDLLAPLGPESSEVAEPDDAIDEGPEPVGEIQAPDFSDILESLDAPPEIVQTEDFLEEFGGSAPAEPTGGVISTDAFLADVSDQDLGVGLSSGLGDELSALTGAGGTKRPQASVNRLPEEGSPLEIRRDQTVSKDLIITIIDGIKNL
jgi:hypothetical protein